ncbi:iron ABC transporter permease [Mycetocola reblochoni]|uniref:Ferric hydroxamate ABC transporter (TC 3.A.1.14.3), permease component FhuB n=1 Tax=Mycetocola reblochoni REB411 TaxID=1255698 RepID=A0A1R4JIL1_9MICO|nr:iron ABC transporter permease [Mycetocola reblochoni]SJN31615.1 Ferric hydroxamate ABC transporter (TC 3.A.1.14.3), permease component FhuB [Mycetocola reblochoni REB411]
MSRTGGGRAVARGAFPGGTAAGGLRGGAPAPARGSFGRALGAAGVLLGLVVAIVGVALVHLSQGTSGVGAGELIRAFLGEEVRAGGVPVDEVFLSSRLPRLAAGAAVGVALGVAGMLLQSTTRNPLASPDTLAVSSGAYAAITAVAAFGLPLPSGLSGLVAVGGGLIAAAVVFAIGGKGGGTDTTRLILAGSAVAMALDAVTGTLLILFAENTTGLYAWGSGSLAQLSIDASVRAAPVVVAAVAGALLLARRLDVLRLGDDAAASLGVPVAATRYLALILAVLLVAAAVTLAGPIAFVGLAAPVIARLISSAVPSLQRHVLLIPASGLVGALLLLLADVGLRAVLGAQGAAAIPTGIPTAVLGGILIVVLALRLRGGAATGAGVRGTARPRSRARFVVVVAVAAALLLATAVVALLAGSLFLRLGDVGLWLQGVAPDLVARALDERTPRLAAALLAGAALAVSGAVVQGTVRNPLAEPGLLGITAGAGLGAVVVVTLLGGDRAMLVTFAVLGGLATFGLITALAWRRGFVPERFVLVGIGCGYSAAAITTFLLLSVDPWKTPRIFTWLSGTSYGRTLPDVVPVAVALVLAVPLLLLLRRRLDLVAVDEDTPRLLGENPARIRLLGLLVAAVLASVSVVAIGVVGFVGLVAPHLARALVGSRFSRVLPVSMLIGAVLVGVADTVGRTVVAPSQIPAGLMIALIGAPYFVWLMRRSRP